jgi:hypothetical protein
MFDFITSCFIAGFATALCMLIVIFIGIAIYSKYFMSIKID